MLMGWPPEGQATVTVIVCLTVAYFILYPALKPHSLRQMAVYDLGVTGAMLLINGSLFAGAGIRFSMLLFHTNWAVFTFLAAVLIEAPLALWYARRNNISFD
ncbi:MAG: hypothetical protein AAFW87_08645 [Pseudomonadota bacterium]